MLRGVHLFATQFEKSCVSDILLKASMTPQAYLFDKHLFKIQLSQLQLGCASVLLWSILKLFMFELCEGQCIPSSKYIVVVKSDKK